MPDEENHAGETLPAQGWTIFARLLLAVGILLCLLAAGAGVWVYTMPYPLKTYLSARQQTRYSAGWAVSEADYHQARRLVEGRLGRREIITAVTVKSQNRIEFGTLEYYTGPLAAAGQHFVVEKVNGVWTITENGDWISGWHPVVVFLH